MKSSASTALLLFLLGLVFTSNTKATIINEATCTVIYSLHGDIYADFEAQKQTLTPHLNRKKIAFRDLNGWGNNGKSNAGTNALSGREKNKQRRKYNIPRNKNHAVILDHNGDMLTSISHNFDLVSILLRCQ